MYEFLRGQVVSRGNGRLVLDVGGIGFGLSCPVSTINAMAPNGTAQLFVHLVVREDRHDLYGFAQAAERHLFRLLLQVSGVGPAAALGLLSAYEAAALASHIASGELAHLTSVKGIGKRTAERILVELRDRVRKEGGPVAGGGPAAGVRADAILALCSLGLPRSDAEHRVMSVKGEGFELEALVKEALR